MNRIIASALIATAALTGAAHASSLQTEVGQFVNVDLDTLSKAEVNALHNIVHSGDSNGEKGAAIRALLK